MQRRLIAAMAATVSVAACAYNEDLGRKQFLLVSNDSLVSASNQAWAETLRQGRVSQNTSYNARVTTVGQKLVQAAGVADRPWQYVVFEDASANAFVLPGGQIGVNTGLLALVQNDDQLAAVIGHEIGHLTAQHAAERYSQTAASQAIVAAGASAVGGTGTEKARLLSSLGGAGAQVGFLLPFSRRHELEADALGVDYMARAGYRPSEAVALWRLMAQNRTAGGPPQMLSTHPTEEARIQALEALIRQRGLS